MNRNIFAMSNLMTLIHFILSILLFASVIVVFTKQLPAAAFSLLILNVFMVGTAIHGSRFYGQFYFMYTYAGRGVFYVVVGLILYGSNELSFYTSVVGLVFILFGIGSIALGQSKHEPPRPLVGPEDFVPYGEKSVSLASQQDSSIEDGLGPVPPVVSQQPTFSL